MAKIDPEVPGSIATAVASSLAWLSCLLRRAEVTAIQEAARRAGSSVTIDVVKHSRSELIAFYDGMSGPETDSVVGFGWNARVNKVEVMLSGVDPEAVAYFRGRIPEDALLIRIVSGRWVAADGG